MSKREILSAVFLISLIFTVGCAGLKGYKIVMSNSQGVQIEYDPVLRSAEKMAEIASEEAAKYGKVPVPEFVERDNPRGIIQMYYRFVDP
jgi:hypothetical protein